MVVAPTGKWPSAAAITELGTIHCAELPPPALMAPRAATPSCTGGCDRTAALISTSIFGTIYVARPRTVVWNGSTLWQPRGSGPAATLLVEFTWLYFVATAQLSTTARPVLVPIDVVRPRFRRELSVKSMPCQ